MQKLITTCILGILVFLMFVIPVNAQYQCSNWQTGDPYSCTDPVTLVDGWCVFAYCADNGVGGVCGPGLYACNDGAAHGGSGNCCAVGAGSGGGGGGGGGGRDCSREVFYFPSGYVRGSLISSACVRNAIISECGGVGSAQTQGDCCETGGGKQTCGEWYDCPTRNNPNKVCRDCEEEPEFCRATTLNRYTCVPSCTPSCSAPLCGQSDG